MRARWYFNRTVAVMGANSVSSLYKPTEDYDAPINGMCQGGRDIKAKLFLGKCLERGTKNLFLNIFAVDKRR